MSGLVGRDLALATHPILRAADPDRVGLKMGPIEEALAAAGVEVGGKTSRQVLGTALNNSQDLFEQASGDRWRWIEPVVAEGPGLSGYALAEEAYRLAMINDPKRQGLHYGVLTKLLLADGVIIRGTNFGKTVFGSLYAADKWFTWSSGGIFTWK